MSTPRWAVRCPAKVNLMLRVRGRRDDGYHELDTVFQAIDLWDTVEIRPAETLSLSCDDPALPVDQDNLVLRAAELLLERLARRQLGGALALRKEIPTRAGLGGGSSDAAGTLLLCSQFWGLDADRETLAMLAADLGADVPFFLVGGTARGRGRGDRIERLEPLPAREVVLGIPAFGISTAEVFGTLASRLTLPRNGVNFLAPSAHKLPEEKDFPVAVNDLERVVFEDWPELKGFRDALTGVGAERALLSGSGSAVYGLFRGAEEADSAAHRLRAGFSRWRVLRSRTVRDAAYRIGS